VVESAWGAVSDCSRSVSPGRSPRYLYDVEQLDPVRVGPQPPAVRPGVPSADVFPVPAVQFRLPAHYLCQAKFSRATPRRTAAWAWSNWRRHHQHQARTSHYRRRQALYDEILL
jgi:hypothetical protein